MADFNRAFSVGEALALGQNDDVGVFYGTDDPTSVGQAAPLASLYFQSNNLWWRKVGPADTDWVIVFGTEHHWAQNSSISTTTSNNFQTKLSLTTNPLLGGIYRLEVNYGWFLDSISDDFEGRVLQNGVQIGELHKQEPKDNSQNAQRMYVSRKGFLNLSPGTYTYTLQFRTDGSPSDPASIFEATIELWRVS